MSSMVNLPNYTFTGRALSSRRFSLGLGLVSSERLEKLGIKITTPRLQGKQLNHYITVFRLGAWHKLYPNISNHAQRNKRYTKLGP